MLNLSVQTHWRRQCLRRKLQRALTQTLHSCVGWPWVSYLASLGWDRWSIYHMGRIRSTQPLKLLSLFMTWSLLEAEEHWNSGSLAGKSQIELSLLRKKVELGQGRSTKREESKWAKQIFQIPYHTFSDRTPVPERALSSAVFWKVLQRSREADTMLSPWQPWIYSVRESRWGRK